jgi:hypothetical protein
MNRLLCWSSANLGLIALQRGWYLQQLQAAALKVFYLARPGKHDLQHPLDHVTSCHVMLCHVVSRHVIA